MLRDNPAARAAQRLRDLIACLLCAISVLAAPSVRAAVPPVHWQFQAHGGTAYLLQIGATQLLRYDLDAAAWLLPIAFAEAPSAFAVGDTQILVATGRKIERVALDGTGKSHVANTAEDVAQLLLDGNLLFARSGEWAYQTHFTSFDATSGAQLDVSDGYGMRGHPVLLPGSNRLIGADGQAIDAIDYDAGGQFTGHASAYASWTASNGKRLFLFPDGARAALESGRVVHTGDLSPGYSFGLELTDLAFHGADLPVALAGDQLIGFDQVARETGRVTLERWGGSLAVHGGRAFVFQSHAPSPHGIGVQVVALDGLSLPPTGTPISPEGLAYPVTASVMDGAGIVYLLSKPYSSIFRWDLISQRYLSTLPLPQPADVLAYSEALDRLYVYAADRQLLRLDLSASAPTAAPHATVPAVADTLVPMGQDLLVARNGSWDARWLYGASGQSLATPFGCCAPRYHFYDPLAKRLFFDAAHVAYLGNGQFGTATQTYDHQFQPLRLSPDGTRIADARGLIYRSAPFAQQSALSNDIWDALWNDAGTLFTVKEGATDSNQWPPPRLPPTVLQKWTSTYGIERELVLPGTHAALYAFGPWLLQLGSAGGMPAFHLLDFNLDIVPPATLQAPELQLVKHSASAARLAWADVQGERTYELQRRLGAAGAWQPAATLPVGTVGHVDEDVVTGDLRQYRVRARNGALASDWSNVVDLDLTPPPAPVPVDPAALAFLPDDAVLAANGRIYLLSRAHQSLFAWDPARQRWVGSIALRGAPEALAYSPEQHVFYTVYADGGIYSLSAAAAAPFEVPFATLAGSPCGLVAAGVHVVACDNPDAYYRRHASFDASGTLIQLSGGGHAMRHGTWSRARGRLYYIAGDYPHGLHVSSVAPDGTVTWIEGTGSQPDGEVGLVRVDPAGVMVVIGSGQTYDAATLDQLAPLPAPVDDAAWIDGTLLTLATGGVRTHAGVHLDPTLRIASGLPGLRLFPIDGVGLVVLWNDGGTVAFGVYDDSYQALETPILSDGFE